MSKKNLSCCIIGKSFLSVRCAKYLLAQGFVIHSVFSDEAELIEWATSVNLNIQVCTTLSVFQQSLLDQQPDYLFSIANPHVLSEDMLNIPRGLAINYHDALLPSYAGVHATSWAIMNGEEVHGISWHVMTSDVDGGDILKQCEVKVDVDDTALSLNLKCYDVAFLSFRGLVDELTQGTYIALPQKFNQRTYYGYQDLPPNLGLVDARCDAAKMYTLYRALSFGNYVNRLGVIKFMLNGVLYSFKQMSVTKKLSSKPAGTVVKIDAGVIHIATKTYDITIAKILDVLGERIQEKNINEVLFSGNSKSISIDAIDLSMLPYFTTYVKGIIEKESGVVQQLEKSSPIKYNTCCRLDSKNPKRNSVSLPLSAELHNHLQINGRQIRLQDLIYTACFIYLHCCDDNYGNMIGVWASCGISDYSSHFSTCSPCVMSFDDDTTAEDLVCQLHDYFNDLDSQLPFLRDVILRYPQLSALGNRSNLVDPPVVFYANQAEDKVFLQAHQLGISSGCDERSLCLTAQEDLVNYEELHALSLRIANLLRVICKNIYTPIYKLPLLTSIEEQLLNLNPVHTNYKMTDVVSNFRDMVTGFSNNIAIIEDSQRYTYQEFDHYSDCVAHHLITQGGMKQAVGIYIKQSAFVIIGMLGILKAGGAYVYIDQNYPEGTLENIVESCDISFILSDTLNFPATLVKKYSLQLTKLESLLSSNLCDAVNDVKRHATDLAYITYTSGTTGKPKGVQITDQGIIRLVKDRNHVSVVDTDVFSQMHNLSFDAVTFEIWGALLNGATIRIISQQKGLSDLTYLTEALEKCTVTFMTPSLLNSLIRQTPWCFKNLRYLVFGGESAQVQSINQLFDYIQIHGYDVQLINGYGPTENTTFSTYYKVDKLCKKERVPIGKAINFTQTVIANDRQQLLPSGLTGELLLSGLGLSVGYVNDQYLTRQSFIKCVFRGWHNIWYRTGDLVCELPDGNIDLISRLDRQIKLRGMRIELVAIEEVIASFSMVDQSVVILRNDTGKSACLVAYLLLKKQDELVFSAEDLRQFIAQRLPDYMVPKVFIVLDEYPLTKNKKIDFENLPRSNTQVRNIMRSVDNKVEQVLLKIWCEVFANDHIGIQDNYFDLGGDSILSIEIIAKAQEYHLFFTNVDLFKQQTIKKLAQIIQVGSQYEGNISTVATTFPLTPIQKWVMHQDLNNIHGFTQNIALYFDCDIDEHLLEQAMFQVISNHEVFKLIFKKDKHNTWIQAKSPLNLLFKLRITDANNGVEGASLSHICSTHLAELQSCINIEKGPLIVAECVKTWRKKILLISVHHLIIDGVSWRLLLEELDSAYQQLQDKYALVLPLERTTYQQWQLLLDKSRDGEEFKKAADHWSTIKIKPFCLPYDKKITQLYHLENDAAQKRVALSVRDTAVILQQLPKYYEVSLQEILLATFFYACYRLSGQSRINLNIEGHGRDCLPECDLYRTVGWFTTIYPVQVEIQQDQVSVIDFLENTRQVLRNAKEYGKFYLLLKSLQSKDSSQDHMLSPTISFNFLGHFERWMSKTNLFSLEKSGVQFISDGSNARSHLIDLSCWIMSKKVHILCRYSKKHYLAKSISKLMAHYIEALKWLINDITVASKQLNTVIDNSEIKQQISGCQLPLLPAQQGILFYYLHHPTSKCYLTQVYWHEYRAVNIDKMEKAWCFIIQRHAFLRAQFLWGNSSIPVQFIQNNVDFRLNLIDLSSEKADKKKIFEKYLLQDRQQLFDLSKPLPMRVNLFRFSPNRYIILWTHHHIILDGWSMNNIIADLYQYYNAAGNTDIEADFPPLPKVDAYFNWLNKKDQYQMKAFWVQYLSGYETCVPSFLLAHRNDQVESVFKQVRNVFNTGFSTQLRTFAKNYRLSLNSIMQFAWALLMSYYSRTEDQVIGIVVSSRPADVDAINDQAGLFINVLPFRLRLLKSQGILEHLYAVQQDVMNFSEYSAVNLIEICQWLDKRGASASNLFDALFVFENYPALRGGQVQELTVCELMHYPVAITVYPREEITCILNYDVGLVANNRAQEIIDRYQVLLQNIMVHVEDQVQNLSFLRPEEAQLLLKTYNNTLIDYPCHHVMAEFDRAVAQQADVNALIGVGQPPLSYFQLNMKVNQVARLLKKMGLNHGELVGVKVQLSTDAVIVVLAILKIGCAYVPMNPSDPLKRRAQVINNVQLSHLFTDDINDVHNNHELCATVGSELILHHLSSFITQANTESTTYLSTSVCAEDISYVIHTSGTTGTPKGVLSQHMGVTNVVNSIFNTIDAQPSQRLLALTALTFDIHALEILGGMMRGLSVYIPPANYLMQTNALVEYIDSVQPHIMQATPTLLEVLLQDGWQPQYDLTLLCGGEPLSKTLAEKLLRYPVRLWNVYGPTETTIWSTIQPITTIKDTVAPIGKPIANTVVYVLDHLMRPVAAYLPGELYIGGVGCALGYLNESVKTQERFIEHTICGQSQRLFKTGDSVYWNDQGELTWVERMDSQIKLRGHRLELLEIRNVLLSYSGIEQVELLLMQVNAVDQLVAFYVESSSEPQDSKSFHKEVNDYLALYLPSYMMPSTYVSVKIIPRTTSNKVDQVALHELFLVEDKVVSSNKVSKPVEKMIVDIYQALLHKADIDLEDDFFSLGGNSLLTISLLNHLQERFNCRFNIADVLRSPTPQKLANLIRYYDKTQQVELDQSFLLLLKEGGDKYPLFLIHPVGGTAFWLDSLARHMPDNRTVYGFMDPGLLMNKITLSSLEQMATCYIAKLKTIQKKGPYYLGGASLGATLAMEMACQLQDAGDHVAFIGLLDGWAYYPKTVSTRSFMKQNMWRQYEDMYKQLSISDNDLTPFIDLHWQRSHLLDNYQVKENDFPVTLFKAETTIDVLKPIESSSNQWDNYCSSLNIINVLGDHETMFYSPQVESLGQIMTEVLDQLIVSVK